jgi:hypothetical protein
MAAKFLHDMPIIQWFVFQMQPPFSLKEPVLPSESHLQAAAQALDDKYPGFSGINLALHLAASNAGILLPPDTAIGAGDQSEMPP